MVICAGSSEQKFLEASIAYVSGKPLMSDKEFDELKLKLKVCYFHFMYSISAYRNTSWCVLIRKSNKSFIAHTKSKHLLNLYDFKI